MLPTRPQWQILYCMLQHLNSLGPGTNIFKIDNSHAFRHILIDPGDTDLLGLTHKGQIFVDLSLPFRLCLGSFFSQKLSDTICYIMTKMVIMHS